MTINLLGIDIAKSTFQLHGADNSGKAVHKRRLSRRELAAHVANLPRQTIRPKILLSMSWRRVRRVRRVYLEFLPSWGCISLVRTVISKLSARRN